jgi:hypothetical protein
MHLPIYMFWAIRIMMRKVSRNSEEESVAENTRTKIHRVPQTPSVYGLPGDLLSKRSPRTVLLSLLCRESSGVEDGDGIRVLERMSRQETGQLYIVEE